VAQSDSGERYSRSVVGAETQDVLRTE